MQCLPCDLWVGTVFCIAIPPLNGLSCRRESIGALGIFGSGETVYRGNCYIFHICTNPCLILIYLPLSCIWLHFSQDDIFLIHVEHKNGELDGYSRKIEDFDRERKV